MEIRRTGGAAVAVLIVLIAAGVPAYAQRAPRESTVLRPFLSGNAFLNKGKYRLAVDEYRQFLTSHPHHEKAPVARYGLGVCQFRLGDYRDAVTELKHLLHDDDFEFAVETLMLLAQSHLAIDEPKEAAMYSRQVLEKHIDHQLADEAAALQAEALYEAGRFDKVYVPCRILEARWPDNPLRERAELFDGLSKMALGRHAEAADRLEEIIERFPNARHTDQMTLLLAQSLHHSSQYGRAGARYQEVISRGADDYVPDAMYGLGLLRFQTRRPQEAGVLLDDLLDDFPGHRLTTDAQLLRGRVWFELKQYPKGFELFERVSKVDGPYRDDAQYWMAKCELRQGKANLAAQRLERALRDFRDSELIVQMTYDRGVALLRAGEPDEALKVLDAFQKRFAGHELAPDATHLTAATLHQEERYAQSLDFCRTYQDRFADDELAPDVAFLVAENTFLLKDYDEAAKEYRRYLLRHPDHDFVREARFRQGLALWHLDSFDEAEPLLASVTSGDRTEPEFRPALLALGDLHFQRSEWPQAEPYLQDYVAFGLDQSSGDDALLKLGLSRQRQGKLDEALDDFNRLLAEQGQSPHRMHATFEQGQILLELDQPDRAEAAFNAVLALGSDSRFAGHALNHLGSIERTRENHAAAARYFGRASTAFGGEGGTAGEALFQQGRAHMSGQDFKLADVVFGRLVDEYPEHRRVAEASALHAIAMAREGAGSAGAAEALTRIQAVEADYIDDLDPPLKTALWYEKAWCHRHLGDPEAAAATYEHLLAHGSDGDLFNHTLLELAELRMENEGFEEASGLLSRLRGLVTSTMSGQRQLNEQCTYRLGFCQFKSGNIENAADLFEEFLGDYPESELVPSASLLCGESLMKLARPRSAAEHLKRVAQRFPEDEAYGPSLLRLGECHAQLSEWPDSERVFQTYLDRFADSDLWFQAQFGVGWARENQDTYAEAIDAYRMVLDEHQGVTQARAHFQIGECLYAMNRLDEAVREFMKVDILYNYPQWSAGGLYEAGRVYQDLGSPVEAREQFELVRQKYPDSEWASLAAQRLAELQRRTLPGHASGS